MTMNRSHVLTVKQYIQLLMLLLISYYMNGCSAEGISISSHNNNTCIEQERQALLNFKQGIHVDRCGLLSSWGDNDDNRDCCLWHGVRCSNHTGHVIELNLRGVETLYRNERCLEGKLSSSLADLKHLRYLDLSSNYFQNQPIPGFVGSLVYLEHLNLSNILFSGEIPCQLGNLSRLTSLDLSFGSMIGSNYFPHVKSLRWLSHLTLLRSINLSGADIHKATDWLQIVNNLPFLILVRLDGCILPSLVPSPLSLKNSSTTLSSLSLAGNFLNDDSIFQWLFNLSGIDTHLTYLDLSFNELEGLLPSTLGNLHALSHLDLSGNRLYGKIPSSFGNMHSLSYLDLSLNYLQGPVPDTISNIKLLAHLDLSSNNFQLLPKTLGKNLCSLQELDLSHNHLTDELLKVIQSLSGCAAKSLLYLDLSFNQIWGTIPYKIDTFSSLTVLDLSHNRLNGTISPSMGQLSMLQTLLLSDNYLNATLTNIHFSNLSRLKQLWLSNNTALTLDIDADWVPTFQLEIIILSSCKLGPLFPKWLLRQTNYSDLDISSVGISDSIPDSFWSSLPSKLFSLNMSHNKIYGTLPDLQKLVIPSYDDLEIDMSFNNIEGAIPSFPINVTSLNLNNNKFSNPLPFLCPEAKLALLNLDLSNNLLSAELPHCWMNFDQLAILHMENNNISGVIPESVGYLRNLTSLHLRNNNFSKQLPKSLGNLKSLVILDVGYNSLSGKIPPSIGNNLTSIGFLSLRSNNFVGGIPLSLCQLPFLQILDLSVNHIDGTIPKCINNLAAMQNGTDLLPQLRYAIVNDTDGSFSYSIFDDTAIVMWKRKEWGFKNSLGLVKAIDISNNKLTGEIPIEISSLTGLVSLDLSRNNLTGGITPKFGQLAALQFLDLSNNQLNGEIPPNLADLNFLGILDLSYNHLSGKIPSNPQLQRFDASTYTGNPDLCGVPLPNCPKDQPPNNSLVHGDYDDHQDASKSDGFVLGLCISVVLGFIVGFWGVCGSLVLKRSWRHAFFQVFDDMRDKLYVMVSVAKTRLRRREL